MTDETPAPLTAEDHRRNRWLVPMTQAEIDDLDGVYFYDDGYAAADDVQRLIVTLDATRARSVPDDRLREALAVAYNDGYNDGKEGLKPRHPDKTTGPLVAALESLQVDATPDDRLRERIERDARFQDALDALDMATLWLHRTSDLPHMPSHQADSWERKARSGRVALRSVPDASDATPSTGLDVDALAATLRAIDYPRNTERYAEWFAATGDTTYLDRATQLVALYPFSAQPPLHAHQWGRALSASPTEATHAVLDRLAAAVQSEIERLMEQRETFYPSSAAFTAIAQTGTRVLAVITAEREATHD